MYYEEQMVDGVLSFRNRPDGPWAAVSIGRLNERISELAAEVEFLRVQLSGSQSEAAARGYVEGKQFEKDRMVELLGLTK